MEHDFTDILLAGFGLFLLIEGAVYALFPEAVQRFAALAAELDPSVLRAAGAVAALSGLVVVALVRR